MANDERKRTCFVVMPFGEKKDADGVDIDFDDIYRFFFRKAIESLGLECIRCDEIAEAGSIHEKMFEQLYKADVVVVDITSLNANVFYELGVRHTLQKSVTVLIRRKGTTIPFNIQGLQVVEYDQMKFASIERAKERVLEIIKNGLNVKKNDSPVHAVLSLNIGTEPKPLSETKKIKFPLKANNKKSVCLVTGELHNVKDIDVWVNPENNGLLMARPLDNTISGIIRYLGAKREEGKIVEDTIAIELRNLLAERNVTTVDPGEVFATSSGNLYKTNNVKMIFHVAAFIGQFGKGYFPIPDITECIENALRKADEEYSDQVFSSILFPLMGTGSANRDFDEKVNALLDSAINYLGSDSCGNIGYVYFLNYSDREFELCSHLLEANQKVADTGEQVLMNAADSKPIVNGESKTVQEEGENALSPLKNASTSLRDVKKISK